MSAATATSHGGPDPAGTFSSVVNAVVGNAAAGLEKRVATWADRLDGIAAGHDSSGALTRMADAGLDGLAESGGAKEAAGAEGLKATLHHKNPVWAAIRGAWEAGTPVVRAAIIAGGASAVLLLLLSPVPLLVFLLSLLVLAAVDRARAARRDRRDRTRRQA